MSEFVNWERAEQGVSRREDRDRGLGVNLDFQPVQDTHDFDLALANIDGDDFSFWALEHFETSNLNPLDQVTSATGATARNPNDASKAPCDACDASGFECKRVEEGERKGSCTTCVTLGITCSLSLATDSNEVDSPRNVLLGAVQDTDPTSNSSPDMVNSGNDNSPKPPAAPKVGARFSRDAVRILKAWLSTHSHRPYPNDEERENLQRQTGLNKTQIANWLANARRRSKGKFQPTRPTSPSVRGWSGAIEIPRRPGTPALEPEYLSPLQRWQNSPPENEPASVTAIASAILQSNPFDSGLNSPFNITDDDAAKSCKDSSASSFGTSPSSKSFASALSAGSRASFGSFQQKGRRRRRRRALTSEGNDHVGLRAPPKTFQCTFCTETFRTKHDWQRHEKSLHLSLERWICCPKGPKAVNPETGNVCCVFCDLADPDDAHIEGHNHTSCLERSLDERTFYRKDHLRQHLKLVHNAKYLQWSMDPWKVPVPEIRSKCGFCSLALSSWPARVDHLAEHFKTGSEMSSWKGDWGFEPGVLSMVENAIPPYMIHDERNTPLPYQAGRHISASPRNAYELINIELANYIQAMKDTTGAHPSDDEMQHEACRVIYASESLSKGELASQATWFRDLLMSSNELRIRAQMGPLRGHAESFLYQMKVNGKDNIFEDCPMEEQLAEFVKARTLLGLTATDEELQTEACSIVGRMEESSTTPSDEVSNFFLRLIHKTPAWLSGFRQRVGLPPTQSSGSQEKPNVTPTTDNHSQLEHELAEFVKNHQATAGTNPPDEELRRQARRVMYNRPDSWQRTAADDSAWLQAFKLRHFQEQKPRALSGTPLNAAGSLSPGTGIIIDSFPNSAGAVHSAPYTTPYAGYLMGSQLFFNGSFGFRRLAKELMRFAASTMSPNNPNQHIPTDEELQHQARWIMYDDDDPFNRTAADNPEWLLRFKGAIGILPITHGDGAPDALWAGFGGDAASQLQDVAISFDISAPGPMQLDDNNNNDNNNDNNNNRATTALEVAGPAHALDAPLPNPGLVFASREFEDKLVQFAVSEVASSGRMPADEALQARAKEISGLEVWQAQPTPADDPVLLTGFKMMVVEKVKAVLGGHNDGAGRNQKQQQQQPQPQAAGNTGHPPSHVLERGLDAIDPGLLPALEPGMETGQSEISGALCAEVVHVAISEKRLDEIIDEALRSRC